MQKSSESADFSKYIADRDIDARIRSSRDDTLSIVEAKFGSEFKRLDDKISSVISMLRWGIGMFVTIILAMAALAVTVVINVLS